MPWVPTTDFEEEIVNLQPDHDFIYGALSEPEPQQSYPRPKSHIEYANTLRKQAQKQQEQYEATGRMNEKLYIITQVQRMTGTKPLGEQPTIEDWDSVKNVEKETVGMMRYCGLGSSVEQPLNHKVTISSHPVRNDIQVVKSGRRKVPLFFDENVFKLKPKVSNSSSGFESASSSNSNDLMASNDNSLGNNILGDSSFNTSSSSINTSSSFYTGQNDTPDDSNISKKDYNKAQIEREALLLKAERFRQYDKLLEETASLSLSNNSRDNTSFQTANDSSCSWMPAALYKYDDDDGFDKNTTNWPALNEYNNDFITTKSACFSRNPSFNNNSFDSSQDQYSGNESTSENSSSSLSQTKSSNFLQRFIKPENNNMSTTSSQASIASSSPTTQLSYANAVKVISSPLAPVKESLSRSQGAISKSNNIEQNVPRFFTAREIYERKRGAVQY